MWFQSLKVEREVRRASRFGPRLPATELRDNSDVWAIGAKRTMSPARQAFSKRKNARASKIVLENVMAKRKRRYSRSASKDVKSEMHRYKRGTARSGRGGKGGKVKSRKQAIAIGLSKARKKGKKVPKRKAS